MGYENRTAAGFKPRPAEAVPDVQAGMLHVRTEMTLQQVQASCAAAGIGCLVLKGPHLAYTVWPIPTERIWCDLDILVRPEHFRLAVEALARHGFNKRAVDARHRATMPRYYNNGFYGPFGILVELHRDLSSYGRYPVPIGDFFQRAETFHFLETEARGLAPTDLLLHLCLHMVKSYFWAVQRKHFRDIHYLLAKRSIDWRLFLEQARLARARAGCWMALRAAGSQLGAPVPEWVLAELEPPRRRRRWLARWLDPTAFPVYRGPARNQWDYQWRLGLALMDRPRDWLPLLVRYGGLRAMDLAGRFTRG